MKTSPVVFFLLVLASPALAQGLPPVGVTLGAVETGRVHDTITGIATVEPWLRTTLSAETAGLVEAYPLREGDRVVAGETEVCRLRQTTLTIDLVEAEALLARARAESETTVQRALALMEERRALRDRADRELTRAKELFTDQVINKADLDLAESEAIAARFQFDRAKQDYDLAAQGADPASKALEAEVKRAMARLERVRDQLTKTVIVSPVNGRVVRRLTEVGNWVDPGAPVIEVLTLDPVLVKIGVNEKDIGKLSIGDVAGIVTNAHPDREFVGRVRFLVPEADRKTRSFPVHIEVANPDGALMAGMFARVEIRVGEGRETLTVLRDALVTGPQGSMVFTMQSPAGEGLPTAKPIPVKVGGSTGRYVEISGPGIVRGLPIITTGNEKLIPGQPIIPSGGPDGGGDR